MRLIHAATCKIKEFLGDDIPKYSIVSHTWGDEEVTLQQLESGHGKSRSGYGKIRFACRQTLQDGLEWTWIDTCCIDKTSSTELSEAINSMYRWYYNAEVCYAYLFDVVSKKPSYQLSSEEELFDLLKDCRWFTRGWTLQELLAPANIVFFDRYWKMLIEENIGMIPLQKCISKITGISYTCIGNRRFIQEENVATKMSWAARRRCTRLEDTAYCLMGLFGVNMPLLYGEGDKAFARLQQEIWNTTDDHSILCWSVPEYDPRAWTLEGVFAQSPLDFLQSSKIQTFGNELVDTGLMTKIGLPLRTILTPVYGSEPCQLPQEKVFYHATLSCGYTWTTWRDGIGFNSKKYGRILIRLLPATKRWDPFDAGSETNHAFVRLVTPFVEHETPKEAGTKKDIKKQTIYVRKTMPAEDDRAFGLGDILFQGRASPVWVEIQDNILRDKSQNSKHPWCVVSKGQQVIMLSRPYGDIREFGTCILQARETSKIENRLEPQDFHVLYGVTKKNIFFLLRRGLPQDDKNIVKSLETDVEAIATTKDASIGTSAIMNRVLPGTNDPASGNAQVQRTTVVWGPPELENGDFRIKMFIRATSRILEKPGLRIEVWLTGENINASSCA